jgi:hypothetical protein
MSPSREVRGAPWLAAGLAVGLVMAVGGSVWLAQAPEVVASPGGGDQLSPGHTSPGSAPRPASLGIADADPSGGAGAIPQGAAPRQDSRPRAPLSVAAQDMAREIDRLSALPPGDQAIAVGQHLAASATPAQAPAFLEALLRTTDPAIERVAIAALARTADSTVVQDMARAYGELPAEHRGRVLQVLEGVSHPAVLDGLTRIVASDTGERRSPVTVSALYGAANVGTMDSIDYLLRQTGTDNIDFAMMALERVRTRQGVELIRAAARGSKDHADLSPGVRQNLDRLASVAEAQLRP